MSDKSPSLELFEQFDFQDLPIGIYKTSIEGRFIVANRIVREMLSLPLEGEVNANIINYYVNPADRDASITETKKLAEQGKHADRRILHLKAGGRELYVEDYCKILNDNEGRVVGFAGCMVDVTTEIDSRRHEVELQERVKELTFDIGRILHTSNTTLLMTDQTLTSIINVLEPNPFVGLSVPRSEELNKALAEKANLLARAISRFLQTADEERRLKSLAKNKWISLEGSVLLLQNFEKDIAEVELRPSVLYNIARNVSNVCSEIKPGFLPKEAVRDLHREAWHLLRVTVLYDALKTRDAVLQMEFTLQTLREYVTSDVRETAKREKIKVNYLVDQTIGRLSGYAQNSHVNIEILEKGGEFVYVNEREVVRALTNLLHNAIKYSWHREYPKPAWVSIRSISQDGKVFIEFENWGVPISSDEIRDGAVFDLGYRGLWSKDRGRLGTGIGLTDAKRVALAHGGDVLIESRPTRFSNVEAQDYYDQPFVTKATLMLPAAQGKITI